MKSILIVYASRFGSTSEIVQEIADTIEKDENNFSITINDLRDKPKIDNLEDYDGIIVGSGVKYGRWTKESLNFLKQNRNIIKRLKDAGVRLEEEVIAQPEALPLTGMEFVLTGRLEAFSRQEAETRIKALGGSTGSNVTKKTAYLVVGADPGSKLARAQELGTRQLNEEELLNLLKQA